MPAPRTDRSTTPPGRAVQLYKQYVDEEFTWSNFTVEEQAKVIVAPRSNNLLDTTRIEGEFPTILPIKDSLIK